MLLPPKRGSHAFAGAVLSKVNAGLRPIKARSRDFGEALRVASPELAQCTLAANGGQYMAG